MFLQVSVILSTGQGGVCLRASWDTTPSTPPGPDPPGPYTLPRADFPGSRSPPGAEQIPPGADQTPPIPRQQTPLGADPPGPDPLPRTRHTPPRKQTPA